MVRFSCFNAHIHSTKPKKTVHLSAEVMNKAALEQHSDNQSSGSSQLRWKAQEDNILITPNHVTGSPLIERIWKSEEVKLPFQNESVVGVNKSCMRKSQSLGSGLDQKRRLSGGSDSENETVQGFSSERSHGGVSSAVSVCDKNPEAPCSASLHVSSGRANDESVFSVEDPRQFDKEEGLENSNTHYFGECSGEYSNHSPRTPPVISKSCSLPNLNAFSGQSTSINTTHRASYEDLNVLNVKEKEVFVPQIIQDTEGDNDVEDNEKISVGNPADDGFDGYNYVGSAKDWIIPVTDENDTVNYPQADTVTRQWDELPDKDFKMKRIDVWVSSIQDCSPSEGENALSASRDHQEDDVAAVLDGSSTSKHDSKITPGMEAAKRYVSSLSAMTTAAQLSNHGLVMIPFLSAFVSLKALNMSGNAIVRINSGALPRGLHILNLSKNNISTIEGLRELTRLRVLDLSYNRIIRIGHGLASCSSIKELYLAGNKISEVEGLHRLLKLNVLDLRFNKISTTKCLGQLASNYNSLQAISLEGNPAQKNVGDEQLKKYLQGLLPHLAYYNRQSIKTGTLKDSADRSARLGISAHQIDRSLRSEFKTTRKGNHGVAAHKRQSSSIHSRRNPHSQNAAALQNQSRDKQVRSTSTVNKINVRPSFLGSKLLSLRPDLAMQRSRSEGTLGGA